MFLLSTTLLKGELLRKEYTGGAGGYGSQDNKEYVDFMKQIIKKEFRSGNYVVNGVADFFILINEETK
ncbi:MULTISPECIES: hypothetical protein [Peribacillus]|uniref:hypothetical protein n=1 Tax=Peribacillus TaxID=2675229 RepID=UPI002079FB3B|nr:hypothetical protein [Peribacillus asahii]USK69165.1 hypothetical protein LIS76_16555 [Peribacillus asahii]